MGTNDPLAPPGTKFVPLGHVILQSQPLTKEEGDAWLKFIAGVLPAEVFTLYSWVPIQGYTSMPPEAAN